MWLGLALLSCLFWAVVFVLDSHLVDRVFERSWIGVVVSAAFSAMAFPFLAAGLFVTGWSPVTTSAMLLAVAAGIAFVGCQAAHFLALAYTESGIVAAYWSMTPVFVLLASYFILGEVLSGFAYMGVATLVASSVLFCLLDTNFEGRWFAFWVMVAGCLLQAGYYLFVKLVSSDCPAYQGFVMILGTIAITGLAPMLSTNVRRIARTNIPKLRGSIRLIAAIEILHLSAILTGQVAVALGSASLVAAIESTIPAATFLLSAILFATIGKYGEPEARQHLPAKLMLVIIMTLGVWLVS